MKKRDDCWYGDEGTAVRAAAGWDGDRYALVDTPRGEGLVWLSVWDSAVDAGEFYQAISQTAARRYSGKIVGDSSGARRTMTGAGRTISIAVRELQGRPVVLYVDVPVGVEHRQSLTTVLGVDDGHPRGFEGAGQGDDFNFGVLLLDDPDGFDAVHDRHEQIHQDDIRLELRGEFHRLLAVCCFADDLQIAVYLQKQAQSLSHDGMIIDHENSN